MTSRSKWLPLNSIIVLFRQTRFQRLYPQVSAKNSLRQNPPEHFTRRQVDAIFDQLTQGVRLTLDGYWSAATFNDKKRFTFVAQFIRVGDGQCLP